VQAGYRLSAKEVVSHYDLASKLPKSIIEIIAADAAKQAPVYRGLRKHHVLLNNMTAVEAAATKARELGCEVEIAADLVEQPIAEGVGQLIARLKLIWQRRASDRPVCLLSGGEFACSVRGNGVGGRNLETVLRCALDISSGTDIGWKHVVVLSAGTDGIDGNSPAAGAFADETTVSRAHSLGLNPLSFLKESDSFRLLRALDDAIVTGATGTNVRDLRILLAC
jgi:glycerate-2-kinase